jgi:Arc/MetJ-type ribon-helix-helix transcriptional regulator
MSVVQVSLPDELQDLISRQVAEGRAPSEAEFLLEAARRYAEDLDLEDEMVAEAEAGIADADAGRYVTISTPEDAEAWHEQKMANLRNRLAADQG